MTWNHRIIEHEDEDGKYYRIHEVYYDQGGELRSYAVGGATVEGEDLEEIDWVLEKMAECTKKPTIPAADFPAGR